MTTFYIYEVPGVKNGATKHWDQRRQYNFDQYSIEPIIVETYDMPDDEDTWQFIGDREWELADQNGYPRGTHFKDMCIKNQNSHKTKATQKRINTRSQNNSYTGWHLSEESIIKSAKATRRLTWEQAESIRKEYVPYKMSMSKLADKYNTSVSTIDRIINYKGYQEA